jgi:amino acid transporter
VIGAEACRRRVCWNVFAFLGISVFAFLGIEDASVYSR